MDEIYGFDAETTSRLASVVRRVECGDGYELQSHGPKPMAVQLVEITGGLDGQLYPGKLVTYTATGVGVGQNNLGEVRVFSPTYATVLLKTGNVILCRFSGRTFDDNFGLYVPAYPVKKKEVVISVTCVDGNFEVDYEEIVVLDMEVVD